MAIEPVSALRRVSLLERGRRRSRHGRSSRGCPRHRRRELAVVRERLRLERAQCRVERLRDAVGPGNVVLIVIDVAGRHRDRLRFRPQECAGRGRGRGSRGEAEAFLAADVPVGAHLADQLLMPMALAGGGTFRTMAPTAHTKTNADVIRQFLDTSIRIDGEGAGAHRVTVGSGEDGRS